MGTEVLLPSKALRLLLERSRSASTSSLSLSRTVLRRKTRIWAWAKITSERLHGPRGQRGGRGSPRARGAAAAGGAFRRPNLVCLSLPGGTKPPRAAFLSALPIPWHLSKFSLGARVF